MLTVDGAERLCDDLDRTDEVPSGVSAPLRCSVSRGEPRTGLKPVGELVEQAGEDGTAGEDEPRPTQAGRQPTVAQEFFSSRSWREHLGRVSMRGDFAVARRPASGGVAVGIRGWASKDELETDVTRCTIVLS